MQVEKVDVSSMRSAGLADVHKHDQDAPHLGPCMRILEDPNIFKPPLNIPIELVEACRKGDVLLVCEGNKTVQCHSQILALASKVLGDVLLESHAMPRGDGGGSKLVKIPALQDAAEHWLHSLVFLYPLENPVLPALTAGHAEAIATLSHKYDMPRLAALFDQYVKDLEVVDRCTGHFKWVVPNVNDVFKVDTYSPCFTTVVGAWKLLLRPSFDTGKMQSHLSAYLCPVPEPASQKACERAVQTVAIGVLSHVDPVMHTHVCQQMQPCVIYVNGFGWKKFVAMSKLQDTSLGYIRNNSIEFHVWIRVESPASVTTATASSKPLLSSDAKDDMYVFKWLELAWKLKHPLLEEKCMEFLECNAFQAVFCKQFGMDLHASVHKMTPGQTITIMRNI